MRNPLPDLLDEVLRECADDDGGALHDSIPQLAEADPDRFAIALCTVDGTVYATGDADHRFTLQSISKPLAYALALADRGVETVLERVGVEPSGDAFTEISLEPGGRPRNPMINVGAVTTHALIGDPGWSLEQRDERVRAGLSAFAGRELEIDEAVLESERAVASHTLALAYLAHSQGMLDGEPHDAVDGYIRQCSMLVDVRDLAVMAMTLAGGGKNPVTGEQVVPTWACTQALSVMATCGMYDAAGDWMSRVGIPAKSGVAGGVLGALPGQIGAGAFSPRLDDVGTSVRGGRAFARMSSEFGLHLMHAPEVATHVLYGVVEPDTDGDGLREVQLQGTMHFAAAEAALRELEGLPDESEPIGLDLTRVVSASSIGRRLLTEAIERMRADGREVRVTDPDGVLGA